MSSQFAVRFSIPVGFPEVLKDFTREVLRAINMDQTCGHSESDMYQFAAGYFTELASSSATPSLSENEILGLARNVFVAADADNSGTLDEEELKEVMRNLASSIGFSRNEDVANMVKEVMAVADTDDNGVIDYQEFLPVAVDIVQTVYANVTSRVQDENRMIHQLIEEIFTAYDDDGSGFLDRMEFHRVFQDLVGELGMNPDYAKRLSDEVLDATDTNDDGKVSKAEFTPLAIDIVSAIIDEAENHKFEEQQNAASTPAQPATDYLDAAQQILVHDLTREELTAALSEIFTAADTDASGTLDPEEFSRCLRDVKVDLTDEEVNFLLANVDTNDDGVIDFVEFQPLAFNLLVQVMADEMKEQDAAAQWNAATLEQARALVGNLGAEELAETLENIFEEADTNGDGTLDMAEFRACLENTKLGLTHDIADALADKVDHDEDGLISYHEFAPLCYDLLVEVVNMEIQRSEVEAVEEAAVEQARMLEAEQELYRGMTNDEIEGLVYEIFKSVDTGDAGELEPRQFANALTMSKLQLTPAEVEMFMNQLDTDGDGKISYTEFVPVALQILKEITRENMDEKAAAAEALDLAARQTAQQLIDNMTDEQLQQMLQEIFVSADSDGNGTLDVDEFRQCLQDADLGLNDELIDYLVVSVDTDADGLVSYTEFAPLCYELLTEVIAKELKETDEMDEGMSDEVSNMAEAQNILVHGMSEEEVEELIQAVFQEVDTDGNGRLDPGEFVNALAMSKLNLNDDEAESLLSTVTTDEDGMVSLDEFRPIAFQILTEILADEIADQN